MKISLTVTILLLSLTAVAQDSERRPPAAPVPATRAAAADRPTQPAISRSMDRQAPVRVRSAVRDEPVWGDANYRVTLSLQSKGKATETLHLVGCSGNMDLTAVPSTPVVVDGNEMPLTINVTANLTVLSEERCGLELMVGRTIPIVTATNRGPGGQTRSSVQMSEVGLDTRIVLKVGQSLVIQETASEKVTVTLTRLSLE